MDNDEIIQVSQFMVCTNLNVLINRIYLEIGNLRTQDDQSEVFDLLPMELTLLQAEE